MQDGRLGGHRSNPGFFFISNPVIKFVRDHPDQGKANFALPCVHHDYWTHDSYLDFSEVHGGYSRDYLNRLVAPE